MVAIFGAASAALLNWPQNTCGQWLDRPELDQLRTAIGDREKRLTVLLGGPGSGKSALLARLGHELKAFGTTLLALKIDMLPRDISTLSDLDSHLRTPAPVVDCLARAAEQGRTVLLIDQLDALADLMDLHTNRLSAVVSLLTGARVIENLWIILSCREFDFKHDARLYTLGAAPVRLGDLDWEQVEPLLKQHHLRPEAWHAEFRESLRVPQHLNWFLSHFSKVGEARASTFVSYHNMLEEVFEQRIRKRHGQELVDAVNEIAEFMAEKEELWVPTARFDRLRPQIDTLQAEGILVFDKTRPKFGFRHQTLFDFVRARALVARDAGIVEYTLDRQSAFFVRSVLWSTLTYLREADRQAYLREFDRLWTAPGLRTHLRLLLLEFLAHQGEPSDQEAHWLLPVLDDATRRRRALFMMAGSPGWFGRLKSRLPRLMCADDQTAWEVTEVLRRAMEFAADDVLDLLERHWLRPLRAAHVFFVIRDNKTWNDRALAIAEAIARAQDDTTDFVASLMSTVSQAAPEAAPKLVAARLMADLGRARAARSGSPSPQHGAGSDMPNAGSEDDYQSTLRKLLDDRTSWYGLTDVARRAPAQFISSIWPWFLQIIADLAWPERTDIEHYRRTEDLDLDDIHRGDEGTRSIPGAIAVAVETWVEQAPGEFLKFAAHAQKCELLIVHCLLARGYARVATVRPICVLDYLLGDARRLSLGNMWNSLGETCRLITALSPHLNYFQLERLVGAISEWQYHKAQPSDDASLRREKLKWNRECRLRLLSAIPSAIRPPHVARLIEQEECELGVVRDLEEPLRLLPTIGSPMTAEDMARASDQDILALFDELVDQTGHSHPRDPMQGGSVQLSHAFAEFAKANPERVRSLIDRLSPGKHERPVGYALPALVKAGSSDPARLVALVHDLHKRSFSSKDFRSGAAQALQKASAPLGGLDDETCALLESWLTDAHGPTIISRHEPKREEVTILWQDRHLRVLPGGNYPILSAIRDGYLYRMPMAADNWLAVLDRHLSRREEPEVWRALARDLRFLANADRQAATRFVRRLLATVEGLVNSEEGVELLAWTHQWLPADISHACLDEWRGGSWSRGPQAAGEFALLRHLVEPNDDVVARLCRDVLTGSLDRATIPGLRLGMAFSAARLWREEPFRPVVTPMWVQLAAEADLATAKALMGVFRQAKPLPVDQHSRSLLSAVVEHPHLLDEGVTSLVRHLEGALRDALDPKLIYKVAATVVARKGTELGDAGLVRIALSLQRLDQTREAGTTLFEQLMEMDAYKVEETLADLDRRMRR